MDVGSILSRAWQIIWRHKILWIFGILASCAGNPSGNASSWRTNFNNQVNPNNLPPFLQNVPEWQWAVLGLIIFMVVVVIILIAIFLGTIGKIGLIRGTLLAEQGAGSLSFGELFNGSLPYFWRVFLLNLLVGLLTLVAGLFLAAFIALGAVVTLGLGLICLIPMLCLLVPLGWFVSVIVEQADVAIVSDNLGVVEGLSRGWEMVKNNLGNYIVMGLILILGLELIVGAILGIPLAGIIVPAIVGAMAGTRVATGGGLLVTGLCLVLYLPVFFLLNGILRGFITSAWTLTYLRLTNRPSGAAVYAPPAASGPAL